jgi:hypothetical protein
MRDSELHNAACSTEKGVKEVPQDICARNRSELRSECKGVSE